MNREDNMSVRLIYTAMEQRCISKSDTDKAPSVKDIGKFNPME